MLATQSIKARALQEGCRQACTIGLSINEDTKLRKGKEDRWCRGPVQISRGRQGASSKRANGHVAEYGRSFVRSFCHVTLSPPSSTVFRQCRNITPPFSKACPQALYVRIIPVGRSYLCTRVAENPIFRDTDRRSTIDTISRIVSK